MVSPMPQSIAATDLPTYRSHKTVRAAKILAINRIQVHMTLDLGDGTTGTVYLLPEYFDRHEPQVGGYYVGYDDGYVSYSPPKPFESGYSRVDAPV